MPTSRRLFRQVIREYDKKMSETGDYSMTAEANEKIAALVREETVKTLNQLVLEASKHMKDGYNLADN